LFFVDYRKNGCLVSSFADNWDLDEFFVIFICGRWYIHLEQTTYHLCRPIIIPSSWLSSPVVDYDAQWFNIICTLIQNFSKMLQIPNMQTLVKIIPSFNIVSPSFAFLHQPLKFFTNLRHFFTKLWHFFTKHSILQKNVQLNFGKKNVEAWWKNIESLVKNIRGWWKNSKLSETYWSLV
jgi:hypothetical protein